MARSKSLFKGCNTRSLDRINLWPFGEIGPDNVPALQDAIDDRVLHMESVLSVRQIQVLHYGHMIFVINALGKMPKKPADRGD